MLVSSAAFPPLAQAQVGRMTQCRKPAAGVSPRQKAWCMRGRQGWRARRQHGHASRERPTRRRALLAPSAAFAPLAQSQVGRLMKCRNMEAEVRPRQKAWRVRGQQGHERPKARPMPRHALSAASLAQGWKRPRTRWKAAGGVRPRERTGRARGQQGLGRRARQAARAMILACAWKFLGGCLWQDGKVRRAPQGRSLRCGFLRGLQRRQTTWRRAREAAGALLAWS